MGDPMEREGALARYGPLQESFEHRGGYTFRLRVEQTLTGLGFQPVDSQRPLSQLSGGQRTRALLGRLLLSDPDVLILDEPTNHLDITAVEWLENYLRDWGGATLIVSHDRYFLDRVIDTVWEMTPMGFEVYRGNYSAYLGQRQARWERRQQYYDTEMARMEKELDYIRRNIAGQRTSQARGKLKRLSRQIEMLEKVGFLAMQGKSWGKISEALDINSRGMRVEEAGQRLRSLRAPVQRLPDLNLRLQASRRSGDLVLRTQDLSVGYPVDKAPLFMVPDLIFRRGECAAVIGPNGAGKTTFLKTLLGQVKPLNGELILGASLQVGYFAQAHEELNPALTLIEEVQLVAPHFGMAETRSYLARFLFSGDDVFKTVTVLSGGERGRLALAKLALTDANLLLLDEPTNHLDIPAQEILQAVLAGYQGTILLVSHDRYLIDALGSQIWEIDPRAANLIVFRGTYSEYRASKDAAREGEKNRADFRAQKESPTRPVRRSSSRKGDVRRREARLVEVEGEIDTLEAHLGDLTSQLEDPPPDPEKVEQLGKTYVEVQEALETLMREWETLHS
jgi:ATP-binding cassette subfamily F protein 3